MEYKTISNRLVECERALEMAEDDYVPSEIYLYIKSVRSTLLHEFLSDVLCALHSTDIAVKHHVLESVRDYICDAMRLCDGETNG